MKQRWMIAVFLLFFPGILFSQQVYEIKSMVDLVNSVKFQQGELRSELGEADIEGSPYLNDEFIEGVLSTTSKTRYEGIPFRYNIYNDQVEIRSDEGQVMGLSVPDIVEKVEFGDYHLEYVPFMSGNRVRRGYFLVEEKGQATLYTRMQVHFEDAKPAAAYQDALPPKFVRKSDESYIRIGMEAARPVTKKNELESVFPDHQKEVADYIRKNRVRPNRPETLKALVRFYNGLVE